VNPTGPRPSRPGIVVVYDEVVKETDRVWTERDALNARAGYIITTGGIVVGPITAVLVTTASAAPVQRTLVHVGMVVALLLFVCVVYYAGRAYGEDDFKSVNPIALTTYVTEPDEEVKWDLMGVRLANHRNNRRVLKQKTRLIGRALRFLLVEVVWLAVVLGIVIGLAR